MGAMESALAPLTDWELGLHAVKPTLAMAASAMMALVLINKSLLFLFIFMEL
jgi:hypothetical protein